VEGQTLLLRLEVSVTKSGRSADNCGKRVLSHHLQTRARLNTYPLNTVSQWSVQENRESLVGRMRGLARTCWAHVYVCTCAFRPCRSRPQEASLKEASHASKKSLKNAVMQTYACFNTILPNFRLVQVLPRGRATWLDRSTNSGFLLAVAVAGCAVGNHSTYCLHVLRFSCGSGCGPISVWHLPNSRDALESTPSVKACLWSVFGTHAHEMTSDEPSSKKIRFTARANSGRMASLHIIGLNSERWSRWCQKHTVHPRLWTNEPRVIGLPSLRAELVLSGPADRTSWLYADPPLQYSCWRPGPALEVLGNIRGERTGGRMAAQRSRAQCGMIRRRADVAARKTGCKIGAPTRECRSEPLEATPESRRFQATSAMASCFANPREPPWLGVRPGLRLPPYHPPPPQVGRSDRAQRLRGLNAPAMTRGWSCLSAGFCCGGPSAYHLPARLEVRCAAEWRPVPSASRDAGEPLPLRCRRRHPFFPHLTFPPRRQHGCTCPRAR